jgi:hypothetical protein
LAIKHLGDNDEAFVYLSSCIGKSELPSAELRTIKNGIEKRTEIPFNKKPSDLIAELGLDKPHFAELCRNGFTA